MFRSAFTSVSRSSAVASRSLHSTPIASKTVTEKVTEVAQDVNLKVGKGLASALETGQKATEATKETLGKNTDISKEKLNSAAASTKETLGDAAQASKESLGTATDEAKKASNVAGQKANQAATGAREAKKDFEKEVKK